jgi:uncharacterized membrane protein
MENKVNVTRPGAKALVVGLIMIIVSLALYFMGTRAGSSMHLVVFAILILGVVVSVNLYGKEIQHQGTFGNYFAHGFKVAAIVALIMIAYFLIFMFVFPEYKETALLQIRQQMVEDKQATSADIESTMEIVTKSFWLFAIGGSLLYNLVAGLIGALIGAGITKKNR